METLDRYLARLASAEPTPGGGSAATLVASSGAALAAMVARICSANPKYDAHRESAERIAAAADAIIAQLALARERDEQAFALVLQAQALPRETAEQKAIRARALDAALLRAADEPLKAAALALDVLHLAKQLLDIPNRSLISDVGCAAEFAYAAVMACGYNVRVNHRFTRDETGIAKQAKRIVHLEQEGAQVLAGVRHAVAEGLKKQQLV
ncbi:MAG TPA: cyclodeaminase/cyclohydrolase family protein [Candidatus Acidoferrales bacterium]|nr:cyclodeaminase/cyclohydrolase family protein [Candidatus Acidoferrales bacterium]